MGESEAWELIGYEIMLTSDGMKIGNGKLIMKDEVEFFTDPFSFNTYVVTNGEEDRIHGGSVAGQTDISEQTTGTIESKDGLSITLDKVSEIYMTVEWWVSDEKVKERIDLYQKRNQEYTFLN